MKLAVWSGPRNISTALMYSFAQREDFAVIDEPFYASYLAITGLDHPMREEVLASQSTDPKLVIKSLLCDKSQNASHIYQKHMTQHMVASVPRKWMADVVNVFLIRHPARVVASFAKKYKNPTQDDIGFLKQIELFRYLCGLGQTPVVVNSFDLRQNPRKILTKLCNSIGLEFDPKMLYWSAGGMDYDGIWAQYWYEAVHQSTGFEKPEGPLPKLNGPKKLLAESALRHYELMMEFCI